MPRKGKRSEAAKRRWRKLDLADPQTGQTSAPQQPGSPPSTTSDGTTLQSPTKKRARFQTSPLADQPRVVDACSATSSVVAQESLARHQPPRHVRGTGRRHTVRKWPVSAVTGKNHKLVIPAVAQGKRFVLIVGDSHLRAIADGFVKMPEGPLSFGVMSTPGATAAQLWAEVQNAVLSRSPEAVCVLAPSNNLGRPVGEAATDFGQLLTATCSRWPNVVVMDFPPRLNVVVAQQDRLRREYRRVAASMGIPYLSSADHFPLSRLEMWCRDGVHLSDSDGMPVLARLLWVAARRQLESTAPTPPPPPPPPAPPMSPPGEPHRLWSSLFQKLETTVPPAPSLQTSPPMRVFLPKVVVKGEVTVQHPSNPFDWTLIGSAEGRSRRVKSKVPRDSSKGMCKQQEDLLQCNIPVNPVWFSPPMLVAMDKLAPSHLPSPETSTVIPKGKKAVTAECQPRRPASKRRVGELQMEATSPPSSTPLQHIVQDEASWMEETPHRVELPSTPTPPCSPGPVVVTEETCAPSSTPPQHIVMDGTSWTEAKATLHTVELPSTPSPPCSPETVVQRDICAKSSMPLLHIVLDETSQDCGTEAGRRIRTVWATHSQMDLRYDDCTRNNQCTCMALTFLAYHAEGFHFDSDVLDRVLENGDSLYAWTICGLGLRLISNHLTKEEMPKIVHTDNNAYTVTQLEPKFGLVRDRSNSLIDPYLLPLARQLECLSQDVTHAFLIVAPECFAVFRDRSGCYGFFDSHSRSSVGLPVPNGTAIMMTFSHLDDLVDHVHELLSDRSPDANYELVPVSFGLEQIASDRQVQLDVVITSEPTKETDAAIRECVETDQEELIVPPCVHVQIDFSKVSKTRRRTAMKRALKCQQCRPFEASNKPDPRQKKRLQMKVKYVTDTNYRQQKLNGFTTRYRCDSAFKNKQKTHVAEKYHRSPTTKKTLMSAYVRRRYQSDLAFVERQKLNLREGYHLDSDIQVRKKLYQRERYQRDPAFQARQKLYVRERYQRDPAFQARQKLYVRERYHGDPAFQARQKLYVRERYHGDPAFQARQRLYLRERYHRDPAFQARYRVYLRDKYRNHPGFKQRWAVFMKTWMQKYRNNPYFQNNKYVRDSNRHSNVRLHVQRCEKNRLNGQRIRHKLQCALQIKTKYMTRTQHSANNVQDPASAVMKAAISSFRERVAHGPTYVCTVCHRALFLNQVQKCNRGKYSDNHDIVAASLTGKYVHVCNNSCSAPCTAPQERKQEWICHSCDSHLRRCAMPPLAVANKLDLAPIPQELSDLNVLERQLIAKIIPFAKIVALPKGRQRAVHGSVVCVPSEMEAAVNSLPRPRSEAQLLQVKLKRRLRYKGHQHFYTVNMANVIAGLRTLIHTHPQYRDVCINESAAAESVLEGEEEPSALPSSSLQQEASNAQVTQAQHVERDQEELRPGLMLDTCMQPLDIAQESLSFGDGIFSIAPAQQNKPVGFFAVPQLEAMAFPVLFPTGKNTMDEERIVKVSPSSYFNTRLFSVDPRFAEDQGYLFFAQFVIETYMANNSMSIQSRKGKPHTADGRKILNRMIQDKAALERLIQNREATRFMQPLRGTPAYWEKAHRELHAMARQLGKPTFFLTFSAAEMRWPEVTAVIKAQQGQQEDHFSDLDWNAKCEILRSNPVTVMRMFEKRVDALLELILSPAQPIGPVEDYFYRVEFQARGSPHIHMVVWIKDAPVIEEPDPIYCGEVVEFIDRYITCHIPDQTKDPELHEVVTSVQTHSRSHTKSCRKGNVSCRFGFPKLPMDVTTITFPFEDPTSDDEEENDDPKKKRRKEEDARAKRTKLAKKQRESKEKLKQLRERLMDTQVPEDLTDLLNSCQLTLGRYKHYVENLSTGMAVHLKRTPQESWTNAYNPHLLRAWNANMDIQYILDDISCIMYMMSYISKPEHEMTEFLKSVIKDVQKSDANQKEEMQKIMQAYSKHREVSAQEAVARTCSLPLKKSSRNVVFLQTDEDGFRMSLPMSRLMTMHPDSAEVWMSSLPEKYANRPRTQAFESMCLAEFASDYRVVYGYEREGPNVIPLLNDMGCIQKRTRGKPAVIRYTRFSMTKFPEKYFRALLKLYLPHRTDRELTSDSHPTYESFYLDGWSRLGPAKAIVDEKMKRFEGQAKKLDKALERLQQEGPAVNAWNSFAPEVEAERLECLAALKAMMPNAADERDEQDDVPAYQADLSGAPALPAFEAPQLSPDFVRRMYRSLNIMQASVFYAVRDWCLQRVSDRDLEPFHYFISGGAGCGKSHVIKCIYQEATKIFRQLPGIRTDADLSQPTVLLTSFTGTAAFNISGKTLHSVLKLPRSLRPPYQGLGNALDTLRASLSNVQILIIDEISMVSKDLFAYVHWRFQQVKGNRKTFGGISVLVVGDFYQLPPLGRAKPLCVYEDNVLDLWTNFQLVRLTEIMRQKEDLTFAQLLNRVREKRKEEPLYESDRALLQQATVETSQCHTSTLHIFATNKEVDEHNRATVAALKLNVVDIPAENYRKDPRTGQLVIVSNMITGRKRDLPDNLQAAVGARVMIIRNLDIEDGLVNGTFGTIMNIVRGPQAAVTFLGISLDNPGAGLKFRKKLQGSGDDLAYIEKSEESLSIKGLVRRQFPAKLAFGCTAHKVQGMTLSSAVVSLKRVFEPGMAYVALSRTTSLQGLKIMDLDEKKIYADPTIALAMDSMLHASFLSVRPLLHFAQGPSPTLKIVHHNTEGLACHMEDIKSHHELRLADVLCLTETHLSGSISPHLQLEDYAVFVRNRCVTYLNRPDMAAKEGGGVAAYCRRELQGQPLRFVQNVPDLEFLVVKVMVPITAVVATVYRPPNLSLGTFLPNLTNLLDTLAMMESHPIVVCGDFNEDLLSKRKKPILELFESRGYTQLIGKATTGKQTLIDHIYISQPQSCIQSGVLHSYYSYHSPVYCILTSL
uniref:uncharacterized protein LOC131129981 isoform X1 n=1 Tax=Doryrhamphus excisus TaxID=161450 RepID=UPI0025AE2A15|nr:uncharacterized protein LOC131129981 isoform X1 [Doryrhamphus excisus]XP_057929968.1 uncharacterized protein LOC131129981 isoform X1 [Doryrhamphus excisus]XP_057929969.1 uncharacterized protein LOC131129981 isoform X1 [Doryrhamphus excisus]